MSAPPTRRLGALLFDFDHTLTDLGRWVDWQGARDGIAALYAAVGVDLASLRTRHRGFALMTALRDAVAARHSHAHADALDAQAHVILEAHERVGAERSRLLPGVLAVLETARAHDLAVGIVSANAESAIRLALQRLGIEDRFGAVVGRTPGVPPKPAPAMHREALRLLGVPPDAAITIGDSVNDMRASTAAGVLAVGVVGGEGTAEDLFGAGASWVLADLTVFPSLLGFWVAAVE